MGSRKQRELKQLECCPTCGSRLDESDLSLYMTVAQAARLLGISTKAVRTAIARGRIEAKKVDWLWFLRGDSVRRYDVERQMRYSAWKE